MHSGFSDKTGFIIWLYTPKYVNRLKKYGILHYVSKKMNYAVLYIENHSKEAAIQKLKKEHHVREIVQSQTSEWEVEFDGILDQVEQMSQGRMKAQSTHSLFASLNKEEDSPYNFDLNIK